jgi:hypothetical protein
MGSKLALTAVLAAAALAGPAPASAAHFDQLKGTPLINGGPAIVYPLTIDVSGLTGTVTHTRVTLWGISESPFQDLDVLLVGPAGQNVMLVSDACGSFLVAGLDLAFDDSGPPVTTCEGGTFRPTNVDSGNDDAFIAPAPPGPFGSVLADFNGTNPNGTWKVFAKDDSAGGSPGGISGVSLDLDVTAPVPTPTTRCRKKQKLKHGKCVKKKKRKK